MRGREGLETVKVQIDSANFRVGLRGAKRPVFVDRQDHHTGARRPFWRRIWATVERADRPAEGTLSATAIAAALEARPGRAPTPQVAL